MKYTATSTGFFGISLLFWVLIYGMSFSRFLRSPSKDAEFINDDDHYDYDLPAVDAVDNFAKNHDMAYDALKAVGKDGLMDDWGTTPVDETALNGWLDFKDKYSVGTVDPFNGQKVTQEERSPAWRGATLFKIVVNSKKNAIAGFMEKNYGSTWESRRGISRQDHYCSQFLKIYMEKDSKGNWVRKKGMWNEERGKNNTRKFTPKTPKQIQSEQKQKT